MLLPSMRGDVRGRSLAKVSVKVSMQEQSTASDRKRRLDATSLVPAIGVNRAEHRRTSVETTGATLGAGLRLTRSKQAMCVAPPVRGQDSLDLSTLRLCTAGCQEILP